MLSCKSGPFNIFKSSSPHEVYERKLTGSGLAQTAMGKLWINLSDSILENPISIKIPYLEKGYFAPENVEAVAFQFNMQRGQKLYVKISKKPLDGFMIYADVWKMEQGEMKLLVSGDTLGNSLQSDIGITATYIIRLQPELLAGGEYTLEITSGPSLAYPLKTYQNNQVRSFFGDGRDSETRKHEGIDIFSSFRTPVLAIAPGITRVNQNNLGGKVVWLRPQGKDFTLYYAHLDEQSVSDGQMVQIGDTLGRMGNTGNARTTLPHLHFGVYTGDGAVDPLPFINPKIQEFPENQIDETVINLVMRTKRTISLSGMKDSTNPSSLSSGTIVRVKAAALNRYRVELPDGTAGYLSASDISSTAKPLLRHKINLKHTQLYDRPDSSAAVKMNLKAGQTVNVLGNFGNYELILGQNEEMGWIRR